MQLLAMLRQQIEPRLTRHGMQFNWQIQPLPHTTALAPEQATHVLRILQEAFTNILSTPAPAWSRSLLDLWMTRHTCVLRTTA